MGFKKAVLEGFGFATGILLARGAYLFIRQAAWRASIYLVDKGPRAGMSTAEREHKGSSAPGKDAEAAPAPARRQNEKAQKGWLEIVRKKVVAVCHQGDWNLMLEMFGALEMQLFLKCYADNLLGMEQDEAAIIEGVRKTENDPTRLPTLDLKTTGRAYLALEPLVGKKDHEVKDAFRFVRNALTWRCVRLLGVEAVQEDYVTKLETVLEKRVLSDVNQKSQLLNAYQQLMRGCTKAFQSTSNKKTAERGKPRNPRGSRPAKELTQGKQEAIKQISQGLLEPCYVPLPDQSFFWWNQSYTRQFGVEANPRYVSRTRVTATSL